MYIFEKVTKLRSNENKWLDSSKEFDVVSDSANMGMFCVDW